jgi:hypothetical protein
LTSNGTVCWDDVFGDDIFGDDVFGDDVFGDDIFAIFRYGISTDNASNTPGGSSVDAHGARTGVDVGDRTGVWTGV